MLYPVRTRTPRPAAILSASSPLRPPLPRVLWPVDDHYSRKAPSPAAARRRSVRTRALLLIGVACLLPVNSVTQSRPKPRAALSASAVADVTPPHAKASPATRPPDSLQMLPELVQ